MKKGKPHTGKRFDGNCNNCSWYRHHNCDCWEEDGGKHGQAPKGWKSRGKKNKDSELLRTAHIMANENEPDAVWLVESLDEEIEAISTLPFTTLAHTSTPSSTVELYDSSASQHLSPYHECFVNFNPITPKPIKAADKHTFDAVRCSNLHIEIPNGISKTRILLKNVLYTLSMGITLILIRKLAAASYAVLFCNSVCCIFNPHKKLVGEIAISNGLYHTKHTTKQPLAGAATSTEVITMSELHAHLSHIVPSMI